MPGIQHWQLLAASESIPSGIHCSICLDVARNAHRCSDEHVFCYDCISKWLSANKTCPIDRKVLCMHSLTKFRFVQDIVNNLQIRCLSSKNSCMDYQDDPNELHDKDLGCCDWNGKVADEAVHLQRDCEHVFLACTVQQCCMQIRKKRMQEHINEHDLHTCAYCPSALEGIKALEEHELICLKRVMLCNNGCGEEFVADQLQIHQSNCELQEIHCPYHQSIGCLYQCKREKMKDHANDIPGHFLSLMKTVAENKAHTQQLDRRVQMLSIHNECMKLSQNPKLTTGYFCWKGIKAADLMLRNYKSTSQNIGALKFRIEAGSSPPAISEYIGTYCGLDSPLENRSYCMLKVKFILHMKDDSGQEKSTRQFELSGKLESNANLGLLKSIHFAELKDIKFVDFDAFVCYEILPGGG
jgi:hypothetical protein